MTRLWRGLGCLRMVASCLGMLQLFIHLLVQAVFQNQHVLLVCPVLVIVLKVCVTHESWLDSDQSHTKASCMP